MWRCALGLGLALGAALSAAVTTVPLRLGEPLPELVGETLQGSAVRLPADCRGATTLVVITFSRSAGEAARPWSERFAAEFRDVAGVTSYGVLFLGDAPAFARGMAVAAMRRAMPPGLQAKTVVIEAPAETWRSRLQATFPALATAQADGPFLLLVDREGEVARLESGAFDESRFATLVGEARRLSSPAAGGS